MTANSGTEFMLPNGPAVWLVGVRVAVAWFLPVRVRFVGYG